MSTSDSGDRGFGDPVFASQAWFRHTLDALARPGTIQAPQDKWVIAQAPLGVAATALALTLLDATTRVWLSPTARSARIEAYLQSHTDVPLVDSPADADYALVAPAAELPALASFAWGTDELPEGSTSVIVQVDRLEPAGGWRLQGPGIEGTARLAVDGLPDWFARAWRDNHAAYPRGVDVFFVCGARFCALPRTIRVED